VLEGIRGHVAATLFSDVTLELLNARLFALDAGLSLKGDSIVSV